MAARAGRSVIWGGRDTVFFALFLPNEPDAGSDKGCGKEELEQMDLEAAQEEERSQDDQDYPEYAGFLIHTFARSFVFLLTDTQ